MEEPRTSPPPWLPAPRPEAGPPALPGAPIDPPPPTPPPLPPAGPRPRFDWRRFTRSPRGAAGVAVVAAALLLWPFAGLSWIPWLIGLAALVVLRLLRLDGPLRGWDLPLAGLAVVVGLMMSTGPWAWALAASIGVLLAGLAQLPWWRLAAVGAVLCVVSGVGYGISTFRAAELEQQVQARAGDQARTNLGAARPDLVLRTMLRGVELDDAQPICRLLSAQAESALLSATRAPDCSAAVSELNRRSSGTPVPDSELLPRPVMTGGGWAVDGCTTEWAGVAGPALGQLLIEQTDPLVQRFVVSGFAAC